LPKKKKEVKKAKAALPKKAAEIISGNPGDFLLCAFLFILFLIYSINSGSTYNDDDVTRYFMAKSIFDDPKHLLSLWGRPAFMILYAIPAQISYFAVELTTIVLSVLSCYFAVKTAKICADKNSILAALFCGLQPFFIILSFSALTEPIFAFLLSLSLYAWYRGLKIQSMVLASLLPLARPEGIPMLLFWGIYLLLKKEWKLVFLLPLPVLAWNFLGYAFVPLDGNHEVLWLLSGSKSTGLYDQGTFGRYFEASMYIFGPLVFLFSLLGFVADFKKKRFGLEHITVLGLFLIYVLLNWKLPFGNMAGFLRHPVTFAPAIALIALRGWNYWLYEEQEKGTILAIQAAVFVITISFFNLTLQGHHHITEPASYAQILVIALVMAIYLLHRYVFSNMTSSKTGVLVLASVLFTGGLGHSINQEKFLELTYENRIMKQVADWYVSNADKNAAVLQSHIWFSYFTDLSPYNEERMPVLKMENLEKAEAGSIIIWDSHYSHRLRYKVPLKYLEGNPQYKPLNSFIDPERRFGVFVFQKVKKG